MLRVWTDLSPQLRVSLVLGSVSRPYSPSDDPAFVTYRRGLYCILPTTDGGRAYGVQRRVSVDAIVCEGVQKAGKFKLERALPRLKRWGCCSQCSTQGVSVVYAQKWAATLILKQSAVERLSYFQQHALDVILHACKSLHLYFHDSG